MHELDRELPEAGERREVPLEHLAVAVVVTAHPGEWWVAGSVALRPELCADRAGI